MSRGLCALTTGSERWQGRLHGRPSERREGEEGREVKVIAIAMGWA